MFEFKTTAVLLVLLFTLASTGRTQTLYFPESVFCRQKESAPCERWYAKHLRAMAEPSLWSTSKDPFVQSYRFLWLRSFHHPVSVRLEVAKDGSAKLILKVLSGAGGYAPGHIIEDRILHISQESVSHFLALLDKAEFWDSPTEEQENADVVSLDGAQWILEGAKDGRYHVLDRWSPENGPYREAALFLALTLGRLDPRYSEVY
jgi:hypothetical protein